MPNSSTGRAGLERGFLLCLWGMRQIACIPSLKGHLTQRLNNQSWRKGYWKEDATSFLLPELTKSASGGKDQGRRARLKAGFLTMEPVPPLPSPGSSQRMKPCTLGLRTYSKDRHMSSLHLSGHEQLLNNVPENNIPNASVSLGSG